MRVFLTGGTGYIGAVLAKQLVERGHTVHALARNRDRGALLERLGARLFLGDLFDEAVLEEGMKGCDAVFHMAAFAKVWAMDPAVYFDVNVLGTESVLRAARKASAGRVVITSSAGIWGPSLREPIREERARDIDFLNEYESSKALADLRAKDFIIREGMDICFLCPTRVYGPSPLRETASMTELIERYVSGGWRIIPGTGSQLGNYVYAEDVARAHILALEKGERGRAYIVCGQNASYNDFFALLGEVSGIRRKMIHMPLAVQGLFTRLQLAGAELFGREPVLTPSWMGKSLYDWEINSSRAWDELGFRPIPLKEGLSRTVEWIRAGKKEPVR